MYSNLEHDLVITYDTQIFFWKTLEVPPTVEVPHEALFISTSTLQIQPAISNALNHLNQIPLG